MNKNKLIRIVSFLLSVPFLTNGNVLAMKGKNAESTSFKGNSGASINELNQYNEKLSQLRLDLVSLVIRVLTSRHCKNPPEELKIKKKVNFIIDGSPNNCYIIEPLDDNEALRLDLVLSPEVGSFTVSVKRISRECYDSVYEIRQTFGYTPLDYSKKRKYDLPSDSQHFVYNLKLNNEELGKVNEILNEIFKTLESLKCWKTIKNDRDFIAEYQNKYANELYKYHQKMKLLMSGVSKNKNKPQSQEKVINKTKRIKINLKDLENKKKGYAKIASKKQNSEIPHSKSPKRGTLINWNKYNSAKKNSDFLIKKDSKKATKFNKF